MHENESTPCDDCGEVGRPKAVLSRADVLGYYCHDEDKSCYFPQLWELDRRIG
jgi:hypothetical protein